MKKKIREHFGHGIKLIICKQYFLKIFNPQGIKNKCTFFMCQNYWTSGPKNGTEKFPYQLKNFSK